MSQVDVIVPCYKYAHFLRQCVESVLTQEGVDLRVLIIDDASPDDTPTVAAALIEADPRVQYRRHAVNQGHIATYNEGLNWAEGDYTVLLSADDLLAPGALARAAKPMDHDPKVGMIYGRGVAFHSDQPIPEWHASAESSGLEIVPGSEFLEKCCTAADNPVCTPTAVVRTRLQKELGGYRQELPHAGDMEMWMRFAAHSPIGILSSLQAFYRLHSANMSSYWFNTILADLRQKKVVFDTIFDSYSHRINDAERLRSVANRSIARESFWQAILAFDRGDLSSHHIMVTFAVNAYPGLRDEPEWARMAWKRRLGPRFWSALRPLAQRIRHVWLNRVTQPS
ncbi:Glycosyl transferase family 2 [Singulisphaera sp. GP187]|uniref:glycosyltransferase family 2 protein n=1 Tax=Singulisphaera sp. GP187 TaxID=1882752 RepID=UPI00092C2D40|nr:glycosyltransferase [Singulisphaera sp. GP187]SIO61550.1 Glycosyl transferase family 2 [Singulisphaera sp. GP187]